MQYGPVCRKHGLSSPTFYKWKAKYGALTYQRLGPRYAGKAVFFGLVSSEGLGWDIVAAYSVAICEGAEKALNKGVMVTIHCR